MNRNLKLKLVQNSGLNITNLKNQIKMSQNTRGVKYNFDSLRTKYKSNQRAYSVLVKVRTKLSKNMKGQFCPYFYKTIYSPVYDDLGLVRDVFVAQPTYTTQDNW
jgi:hypothetical protein